VAVINSVKKIFGAFAKAILDIDDTSRPVQHLEFFRDYSDKFNFDTGTDDAQKFLNELKKKHLVDDIVVASFNGGAILSTNGNSVSRALSGAALFNYVHSELPKSESLMIKSNGWHMIVPYNKKLYIVKATSDLSNIELKALAKEIESFLLRTA